MCPLFNVQQNTIKIRALRTVNRNLQKTPSNPPLQTVSMQQGQSPKKILQLSYCHFRHGLPETARRKLSVKNGLHYCPVSTVKSKKFLGQCVLCLCAAGCPENGVQRTQVGEVRIIAIRPARHTVADFYLQFKV